MAEELWIRVEDGSRAQEFLRDLAEGDLLSELQSIAGGEDRAARVASQYGIELSPWILETLPEPETVETARRTLTELDYEQVQSGPAALYPVFCMLFPFPFPFLKRPEHEDGDGLDFPA